MGKNSDNNEIWEGSNEYNAEAHKAQQEIYGMFRDRTVNMAKGVIDQNPVMMKAYEIRTTKGGMLEETINHAIQLFREGKTAEEVRTGLDEFMKENSSGYKEKASKEWKDAVADNIADGAPQAKKMHDALDKRDQEHEHNN